jgi:preprotein translocase subunit YajC
VTKVGDEEAEVEIAQGVKIKVVKSTISQVLTASAKPAND